MWAAGGAVALVLVVWLVWSHGYDTAAGDEAARNEVERLKRQRELFDLAGRLSEREVELERFRDAQTHSRKSARTPPARPLATLALLPALMGCGAWGGAGALYLDPLPASVEEANRIPPTS